VIVDVSCQGSHSATERQSILLLDSNAGRALEICRVAGQCGAAVRTCDRACDARRVRGTEAGGVAVVGILAGVAGRSPSYEAIRELKTAGFTVIGCQDGASGQPLGQQCSAFLAGCAHLLDSTRADFGTALHAALLHRLQEDAGVARGHVVAGHRR
jgi:hypothetical protein